MKTCIGCKQVKSLEDFPVGKNYADGRINRCRLCRNEWRRNYRASKPNDRNSAKDRYGRTKEQIRSYNRKRAYGVTQEQFDQMVAEQNGLCLICGNPPSGKGKSNILHVDHCHDTGRIRGLLCTNCNCGIGFFKDDPELVKKALAYLEGGGLGDFAPSGRE